MNRIYKFRVWDKLGQCKVFTGYQMFVDEEVVAIDFYNNEVTVSDFGAMGEKILKFEEIELMQYTGLKDKNGKEIYEGDIVTENYIVQWNDDLLQWDTVDSSGVQNQVLWVLDGEIEVIGNVFENPEQ